MICNVSEKHVDKTPFVTKLGDVKQSKSALNATTPNLTHHYPWLGQQLLHLLLTVPVPGILPRRH